MYCEEADNTKAFELKALNQKFWIASSESKILNQKKLETF